MERLKLFQSLNEIEWARMESALHGFGRNRSALIGVSDICMDLHFGHVD